MTKVSKSYVRRSLYQALMERYKKLSADMKIITKEGFSVEKVFLIEKYRAQYKRDDESVKQLHEAIKNKSKQSKSKTNENSKSKIYLHRSK